MDGVPGAPLPEPSKPLMRYANPILFFVGVGLLVGGLLADKLVMPTMGLICIFLSLMTTVQGFIVSMRDGSIGSWGK